MLSAIRDKMQKSPAIGVAIAGAIIAIALVIAFLPESKTGGPPVITHFWFHDLNTGETFTVKLGDNRESPPHATESGPLKEDQGPLKSGDPAGVIAHKYGCGGCDGEQFFGYLESWSVARRELIASGDATASITEEGMKVKNEIAYRLPDGGDWVSPQSPEGKKIFDGLASKCGGKKPVKCYPTGP